VKTVALFGAKGFVGSEIFKILSQNNYSVTAVTRENFDEVMGKTFDYAINSAMPAARFKAKNDPLWDFRESVEKTAKIYYGVKFEKFVQISSVSARCQSDTIYGRHKLAAESLIDQKEHLIVRLGPMYGPTLSKGVLIDLLKGNTVFVGGESRYAFAPLNFVANWIVDNLDRTGLYEVGARNAISLKDLSEKLGIKAVFEGSTDHQEMTTIDSTYPDVSLVIEYMKLQQRK